MTLVPTKLRTEHFVGEPLGLGTPTPRLSWQLPEGSERQVGFQVEIDGNPTPFVESDEHVLVGWPGEPLSSRQRSTWRVRVQTSTVESGWSDPSSFEVGLLEPSDWTATAISPGVPLEQTALVRTSFSIPGPVARARLYITALGVYEAEINGKKVGDHVLAPGWTSYHHRVRYQTFDVTDLVADGENAVGITVADGWYRGRIGFSGGGGRAAQWGDRLGILAQLEITTADGDEHRIVTDETWRWLAGPTTRASIYDGEVHDERLERAGWSSSGYFDLWWPLVDVRPADPADLVSKLVAPTGPPVRVIESVAPVATTTSPSGRVIVDFGQNLVGRPRLEVTGPYGAEVVVRHAEILQDGELCTQPLRFADAKDRLILRDSGSSTWTPRFTFHGFRYAEITGPYDDVVAEVCHTDLRRTGWFECSDERINRLHENVVWSTRGNFLDVPTDCPQRDERLGWTGDMTVFAPTLCFLYDVAGSVTSWLADLAAEQDDDGVPLVVPSPPGALRRRSAVWGDAASQVPWVLYERYGDRDLLAAQYPSMRRWLETVIANSSAERHWNEETQLGDHLDPTAPGDDSGAGRTDRHLVANAWFCWTARRVAEAAALLGHSDDAERFWTVHHSAVASFRSHYIGPDGVMTSDSPTAYALAIHFGLADDDRRPVAAARLVELVEADDYRIGTGFVGTPVICDALCEVGAVDVAYRLLLQTECPSWLYPVLHGATTIWERWDGIRPDGTLHPDYMNSFNHYAFGAVADWLHRSVAGLAPAAPGYRRIRIRPLPGGGLSHARAWLDTPYGRAESGWRREGDRIIVTAVVPAGSTAVVNLPDGSPEFEVTTGRFEWSLPG